MLSTDAYRALSHFGLGARPEDPRRMAAAGPQAWLRAQLEGPGTPPAALARIPATPVSLTETFEVLQRRRRERMRASQDAAPESTLRDHVRRHMVDQLSARLEAAITTETPLRERLVHFWSNHFTVSTAGARPLIATSCAGFENEAIRAHLDGSFADLLLAVEQHPVMLAYLDNLQSFGPGSPIGRRGGRGLNENLAREILELHTLGVDGGYDQDDVVALARMITGWTVANGDRVPGEPGTFAFLERGHEPGSQRLLGRRYRQVGLEQGRAALRDLARHPATARHLATKLVRHFVADTPPPDDIARIERVFLDTDGHLPSVHATLIELPSAWGGSGRKFRTPTELMVAALRGLDLPRLPARGLLGTLRVLGQFPFQAPSPAGWPDDAGHWGSPNALLQRIDWAQQLAERVGSLRDPQQLAGFMLPPGADDARRAIGRAADASQGLALLVAGPDFQWR